MDRLGPHPVAVAATRDAAREGRDDRARRVLADPAQAAAATEALLAQGGAERERYFRVGFAMAYDAYSRRDWELNTLLLDAECIFRPASVQEMIDAKREFRGIGGYLEAQELLLDVWSEVRVELADLAVRGTDQVVTIMRWRGIALGSGLDMEWDAVSDHRFRRGLVTAQTFWWDRERAEADLGFALPVEPAAG